MIKYIKEIILKLNIIKLFRFISYFFPKNKNLIVFISEPDYSDNGKALYDWAIRNEKEKEWQIYWLFTHTPAAKVQHKVHNWYILSSFKGILAVLRARVIITTHNQLAQFCVPSKQFMVSLGHGIYLKSMGYLKQRAGLPDRQRKTQLISMEAHRKNLGMAISTSETYTTILAGCSHIDKDRIVVTGFPKMDGLFNTNDIKEISNWFGDISFDRIFMYMPTHRKQEQKDNTEYGKSLIDYIYQGNNNELFDVLENTNSVLIVKPHPWDNKFKPDLIRSLNSNRIKIVGNEDFYDLSIYDLLGKTDCLITDYSSVYAEYLALNRPIIFARPDVNEYLDGRGFHVGPLSDWTPGPNVLSITELCKAISAVAAGQDDWDAERQRIRRILIDHVDGKSSERVWKAMEERVARLR